MSSGYAARLSEYPDKGVCGLPELYDKKRSLDLKLKKLSEWVKESSKIVVLTGAGISTSAGIPDFRGPKGVWTLEETNTRKRKRESPVVMDFACAKPTLTHRALTKLVSLNIVQYVVTQNVDGLHRRAGLSRSKHASVHGCAFTERCEKCGTEYFRDFDVGGMSFQKTGRECTECQGDLRDTLLDWEDPLPEKDFDYATKLCEEADLVLALGTSLRIEPAGSLPTKARRFVICNLQETPKDKKASLIIRAPVDHIMKDLMERLGHVDWDVDYAPPIERKWTPTTNKSRRQRRTARRRTRDES